MLLFAALNSQISITFAQGTAFTYQGRLNVGGSPANGLYDYRFKLYVDPLGSTQVGSSYSTNAIPVTNGLFITSIDFGAGIFTGYTNWLEVDVKTNLAGGYTVLSPLQRVTPTPNAIFAETAGNVSGTVSAVQLSGAVANGNLPASPTVSGTVTAGAFAGNGASVTSVNATALNGLNATNFWQLGGNNVAAGQFLGSTNYQPVEIWSGGNRLAHFEAVSNDVNHSSIANVINGSALNSVNAGAVGVTIAGGGSGNYYGSGGPNQFLAPSDFSTIGGGFRNLIYRQWATIGGGDNNTAGGDYSSVGGGSRNFVIGSSGSIGGGAANTNIGFCAVISGGTGNLIPNPGYYDTIGGGLYNTNSGYAASLSGGQYNLASGYGATVAGGEYNTSWAMDSTVAGGAHNLATNNAATIGGGQHNLALGSDVTIGGGYNNNAQGESAVVAGGWFNNAGTNYATVPGGQNNAATGDTSFAAGQYAYAQHAGTFVWADGSAAGVPFASTGTNQFLIRAKGGVGINTNNPNGAALNINGTVVAAGFGGNGSNLTSLNANNLTSGALQNARLSPDVAFLDSNQLFTAQNVFSQPVGFGNPFPNYSVDAQAAQAVGRFISTNAYYGSVLVLENHSTNLTSDYLGAVNFNNSAGGTPGQVAYIVPNSTNQNYDYLQFTIAGNTGLRIQGDLRGLNADNLVGGYFGNQVSAIGTGGNVIAGGGYSGAPNLVLSNTGGVFIGAGSANQIGPNFNDSAIVGGYGNIVQSPDACIAGGFLNIIPTNSTLAFIGGGQYNTNAGIGSAMAGGSQNAILPGANYSFLGSGNNNFLNAYNSAIVGGSVNTIQPGSGDSFIGGGQNNTIQANGGSSFIGGGSGNSLFPFVYFGSIGGGSQNTIKTNANSATIAGGLFNTIQSYAAMSSIGGGYSNQVGTSYATIPGGRFNLANGLYSFAAGQQAQALHAGSFVWADSQSAPFASTANNQFAVRAAGGVNFQTAGAGLTVDGQPVLSGSSSTNYIQNQTASPQSAAFNINGNGQIAGLIRSGSETGTTEAPLPAGLVARRINSLNMTSGNVLARTDTLTLERDGTHGGFLIRYGSSPGTVTIACMGMDSTGTQKNFYTTLASPVSAGTVQLYTDSQNIVHFECTFGVTFNSGQHLTQATLSRYGTDYFWSGNVISTYNQ